MKKIVLLAISLLTMHVYAGNYTTHAGGRDAALSGATICVNDAFSVFNNPAAGAITPGLRLAAALDYRFGMKQLATNSFAFSYGKEKIGTFGLSFSQFGFSLYNEQIATLSYARVLSEKLSGGMQFHYIRVNLGDEYYGNKGALAASLNMFYKTSETFSMGFNVFNLTNTSLAEYNNERIPTIIRVGARWQPNIKVAVNVETEKNLDQPNQLKLGVEYRPLKQLSVMVGVKGKPAAFSFGVGYALNKWRIDFASSYHPVLGYSPVVGLSYGIN
ncbi:MAG: hypothetical protein IPO27_19045 [Bacteroidetes bacterium]|nr:hypothetical protein [Bacteroidota bacterium]